MLLPRWESSPPALCPYKYFKYLKKKIKNILLSNLKYTAVQVWYFNAFSCINNTKTALILSISSLWFLIQFRNSMFLDVFQWLKKCCKIFTHFILDNTVPEYLNDWFQDTHQYLKKASPAQNRDSIKLIADMNLLVAMSTCSWGT